MTALLTESDNVGALSFDPISGLLAVANGASVDLFRGSAVVKTITPAIGTINNVSLYNYNLIAVSATDTVWVRTLTDTQTDMDLPITVDSLISSTYSDSYAYWPSQVTASYQAEAVPSGEYKGVFIDLASAVLGGAGVGDWYKLSGKWEWYEVLTVGPDTEQQIFRAGQANFPTNFAILADSADVVIFDISSGVPEMWKARALTGVSSVAYAEGQLEIGTSGGRYKLDYVSDETVLTTTAGTSTAATVDGVPGVPTSGPAIVNDTVNEIAAKVLAGAADATAGLKVPTWAAATNGGVSVGVDTGDVWDITGNAQGPFFVTITADDKIASTGDFNSYAHIYDVPTADILFTDFIRRYERSTSASTDPGAPKILRTGGNLLAYEAGQDLYFGTQDGLTIITENTTDYFDGLGLWVTTTYNKGFTKQPGGAWACDNLTADIIAPGPLPDYSIANNDLTVVGTVTKIEFKCGAVSDLGSFDESFDGGFS